MAQAAIIINGLPASGKTTLGTQLALLLGCPVLSADTVTDQLGAMTGPMVTPAAVRGVAIDTVWALARAVADGVVVDGTLSPVDADAVRRGVASSGASRVIEIWCDVPEDVARERHVELEIPFPENSGAAPLGFWPVVTVDTASTVDFDVLLPELASHLLA